MGHDFPTGPLDIIQAWVELKVTDEKGQVVFTSGSVDAAHFVAPGSFMFKAEPVDQHGNLIDKHNLWEMVGVRFRRSLFPGFSDVAEYTVACPADTTARPEGADRTEDASFQVPPGASGTLKIAATLHYRKVDQFLLNFMFGEKEGLTATITDMSHAEATVRVVPTPVATTPEPRSGM